MAATTVPVVIVGAGPVGLAASILLSQRGIRHVLFERHPTTSIHPKACGINQRTMEIFRAMGIEAAVRAAAAPDDIKGRTAWYTSLAGTGPVDGRALWSRDAWGGGDYAAEYATYAATRYEILPQIRLEPILVARARELATAAGLGEEVLRFNAEVVRLEQTADDVTVHVQSTSVPAAFAPFALRARFVLAADGGRGITDALGVPWSGERDILDMVSVHFCAPLRQHHPDPRNFITWFSHPDRGGSLRTGYLYQIGPWPQPADATREEWIFACAPTADDPAQFDAAAMVARLHDTLKVPAAALPVEVVSLSHWHVHAVAADRYRVGRVFLVGDAAHRIPPWGALGMNSGIQDVDNLVWKLALALQDEQGERRYHRLLDSYDAERRPIGRRVGQSSLANLRAHGLAMDVALGVGPDQTPAANTAALQVLLDPAQPGHAARVAAVERAQRVLDLEFKAPGVELGWYYPTAAGQDTTVVHSETFCATTAPGHHLPHAWVSKGGDRQEEETEGSKVALRDLLPLNSFLLLAREGHPWALLAGDLVHVELLGDGPDAWTDASGTIVPLLEGRDALLVRPDGIVAWRGRWTEALPGQWAAIVAARCEGVLGEA